MSKLSFSMRSIATLVALCATSMTAQACSCMSMPTIESSFDNDNTSILQVVLGNEIPPEDPTSPYYTKRYNAYIQTAFKADRCSRLRELYWQRIEVQTASSGSMCGVDLDERETYLLAGNLQYPEQGGVPILSTGSCQYQRKWDALSNEDFLELYHSRHCQCSYNACRFENTRGVENTLCPDETTMAGPSGICRYEPTTRQCSTIVQCPTCEEDWDCQYGQYCAEDGLCTREEF